MLLPRNDPSEEQKMKNAELVNVLIETFDEPRRSLVQKMMDGPVGMSYFTAPASSRLEYHSCFSGGLCSHSLNVVKQLNRIAKALAPGQYPDATLAFVGLFHDLGKVGDGTHEMYVPNPSEWHRSTLGMLYRINDECLPCPNAERGLYVLQKNGIELSFDEWAAIRLNDGQYSVGNKEFAMHEPKLALLVHFADRWACELEK